MTVIGIDPDVHRLAYAVLGNGHVPVVRTIPRENPKGDMEPQYDKRLSGLFRAAAEHNAVVWLEDIYLAHGKACNPKAYRRMAEVHGEIQRVARLAGVPVHTVLASTWQPRILTDGHRAERKVLKRLARQHAQDYVGRPLTEHEADAVCIALYGQQHARKLRSA